MDNPSLSGWLVPGPGMGKVMQGGIVHSTWDMAQPTRVHLLHPHPLLIPSLVSCRSKSHSPKNSFFAPNDVAWRPPSIRDILGVSTTPLECAW